LRERSYFRTLDRFEGQHSARQTPDPGRSHLEMMWNEKLRRLREIIARVQEWGTARLCYPRRAPRRSDASRSHSLAGLAPDQERDRDFETCSGFPLRLVDANSSSSRSLIELYISFAAPLRLPGLVSPRLAASAAPAAFCWAADLAGMSNSLSNRPFKNAEP